MPSDSPICNRNMPNAASKMVRPSRADAGRSFVLQPVDDGRTIFDAALGMFRLRMGESESTSHSQCGVGDHERPVRVARDPAEAEMRAMRRAAQPPNLQSAARESGRGKFGCGEEIREEREKHLCAGDGA